MEKYNCNCDNCELKKNYNCRDYCSAMVQNIVDDIITQFAYFLIDKGIDDSSDIVDLTLQFRKIIKAGGENDIR